MPRRTKRWLSVPFIARLLALGLAVAPISASLAAEGEERPQPKRPAVDPVAAASDPGLWDKMAPFQSVYAQSSPNGPLIDSSCYGCVSDICHEATCISGNCHTKAINQGLTCNSGNPCSGDATCYDGVCLGFPLTGTSCPTGNVCASGTCSAGTCIITPLPYGTSCPTGNVCESGTCSDGTCLGAPLPDGAICGASSIFCTVLECLNRTCTSTSITCDDGNICTLDSCDQANGLCTHIPLPEEAGPLAFTDEVTVQWGPALGASIYETYRGTIPAGGLSGRSPLYDHVCFESGDSQLNGAQLSVDTEAPPVGTSFYYLVDGEASSCGEGPLGKATNGTPEMPIAFCPPPP